MTFRDHGIGHIAVAGTFEVGLDRRLSVRQRAGEDGELYVVAGPDSRILVADELLNTIRHHPERVHPGVALEWQSQVQCPTEACCKDLDLLACCGNNCFYGALLSFDTQEGKIIYRIGAYDLERHAWWAAWPD